MSNFTVRLLDSLPLPDKGKRKTYYDDDVKGLALRVLSTGTKSFVTYKWVDGKKIWTTHGHYPSMTIQQARVKARATLNLVSEGINPNKLNEGSSLKQDITLQKVLDDYSISKHTLKANTLSNYKSIIDNYLSDWKKNPISDISRDMIEKRHRDITQGNRKFEASPSRANTTMRVVRALFNYAIGQYEDSRGEPIILHNPVSRITHNKSWNKENIRQSVVQKHQLKQWYEGVMKLPLQDDNVHTDNSSEVVRDLLIFLMFTGLRRNEALTLKWSDIDFDNHSFTIEDTKNNESHSLPLTFKLDEVLERRKNESDNPYVFQGSTPNGHLHPPKRQLERARELVGFKFDNHSLRRTFETTANRFALSTYTLKKLINHKNTRDVTGRYIVLEIDDLREPMNQISEALWSEMK